jgi:hypothetical protein
VDERTDHFGPDTDLPSGASPERREEPSSHSGLLQRLHDARSVIGGLMLQAGMVAGMAGHPSSDAAAGEAVETFNDQDVQSRLQIAVVQRHPKTNQPMSIRAYSDGAVIILKPVSMTVTKKMRPGYFFDAAKGVVYFDGLNLHAVTEIEESKLSPWKRMQGVNLKWDAKETARLAQIVPVPAEQAVPAVALQESPVEEVIPADKNLAGPRVYPAKRDGFEYACDIPGITVEPDGKGIRTASTLAPKEWTVEPRDMELDAVFTAKGTFIWSYLVPLPPDFGDQKRMKSEISIHIGDNLKSKRSFVTDVVITESDPAHKSPRQAFARITMHGFSGDAREVPLKLQMRSWMAVPKGQDAPVQNVSDPRLQKAMSLRQPVPPKKPKEEVNFTEAEYELPFTPDKNNRLLTQQRLARAEEGYVLTGWNTRQNRVENRYVTPGHIICDTAAYAADDPSFIPLSLGSYGALPKVEGLEEDFAREATALDLFLSVKGDPYFRPSLRGGKMSVSTPRAGPMAVFLKEEAVPEWLTEKARLFAEERQKINAHEQIAAVQQPPAQE